MTRFPLNPLGSSGQPRLFLVTALATRRHKQLAGAIAAAAFLAFAVAVPFVRVPLAKIPAFIPGYEAALFADLVRLRSRPDGPHLVREKPETFVVRQNIAHYRDLLAAGNLDDDQRRAIEMLLAEEEAKLTDKSA